MRKRLVCGCGNHQVVNLPYLWYPSCVEVDWWSGGFVPYPSSERRLLFGFVPIPHLWGWFVLALCLASSERLYWLREELCTLNCINPNPQWRFPVWEVLCERVGENPSVWRRRRRVVCSNLETYLCVCVWSTFYNSLSYIVPCIDSYCSFILICLVLLVCVPYLC